MTLSVDVAKRLGDFALDAAFDSAGGVTALFGASGSGKTSVVDLIAGLGRPDRGRIAIDGTVLVDTEKGTFVPSHRRRIGYVFQDARLFPHLSVRANLGYGRWFAPSRDRYAAFDRVVDLLGIDPLLDRRPVKLSGGEKQRVAIGRALLASPRLLLLDEPLAALDEARKAEIMPYLERLRDEVRVPIVYVSHSVAEIARLATSVVVLAAGRVTASGPAAEVLRHLELLPGDERGEGGSLLEMTVSGRDDAYAMTILVSPAGEIRLPVTELKPGERVRVRLRARDVMIATRWPEGLSAMNVLAGRIVSIGGDRGPYADIVLDCGGDTVVARITRQSTVRLALKPGLDVFAVVKTVALDRGAYSGIAPPLQG